MVEVEPCSVLYGTLFRFVKIKWNVVPFVVGDVMNDRLEDQNMRPEPQVGSDKRVRADAQRNIDALLQAALEVFASSGVDAPVREIAEKAGVGIGTLYRHFPQRSDLVVAVFRHEIDACVKAASVFASEYKPFDALAKWLQRYAAFMATKRGLAAALHSGNPAFDNLPNYFNQQIKPACQVLFDAALRAGEVRADVTAADLLNAVAHLSNQLYGDDPDRVQRMVAIFADGLRYKPSVNPSA